MRARSSIGRARAWHARGKGIVTPRVHKMPTNIKTVVLASSLGLLVVALALAIAVMSPPAEREFVSRSGYTLRYPSHWIILEVGRDSSFTSKLIREPRGRATISISVRDEPRLLERGGRVGIASEIEAGFARDGTYQLDFFKWYNSDIGAEDNGYIATGSFVYDSVNYDFKEIGVFDSTGHQTTFRTEVISAFTPLLGPMVDASLRSIENKRVGQPLYETLTAEQALNRVHGLPSVILYGAEGLEEGRDFSLEVEEDGDAWLVRMFVSLGSGENAREIPVQSWRVDKVMGIISKTVL